MLKPIPVSTLAKFAANPEYFAAYRSQEWRGCPTGVRLHEALATPSPKRIPGVGLAAACVHRTPHRYRCRVIANLPSLVFPTTAAILVAGCATTFLAMNRRRYSARLARHWGLDPATVSVVASDLGRHRSSRPMVVDGLSGAPDAIFRMRRTGTIVIAEVKSRHYRGTITPCERHQVTLYLGMATRLYRRPVTAIILYGNGRRVPLEFDKNLYRWFPPPLVDGAGGGGNQRIAGSRTPKARGPFCCSSSARPGTSRGAVPLVGYSLETGSVAPKYKRPRHPPPPAHISLHQHS